jgi:dienelactone hydrolase
MHQQARPLAFLLLALPLAAGAAVQTEPVEYQDGDTKLTGYLMYDDAATGKRPGVIVAHEWWGLNDYVKSRAEKLAELGYVAFALDMYGDQRVTEHAQEASGWMKQITENVDQWQARALAGLEVLKQHERVDPERLAAVGYCFGGATVMQMAYAGADLAGVVSFHGSLPPATEEQQKQIKASVLVAHGSADTFVPAERVLAFQQALDAADADWRMITYGGARHGFTNPSAGDHGIENLAYDAQADEDSWAEMKAFLSSVLSQ